MSIVKHSISKVIYRLKAIPIKVPMAFLKQKFKNNSTIHMEPHENPNQFREEQSWMHHITLFQKYYKATVIETVWYRQKDRPIGQWNRMGAQK